MTDHVKWFADTSEPERYNSSIGGDNQVSDVWFVRLRNLDNYSTVSVNVYVIGFPDQGNDEGMFEEFGIEVCIEWDEWQDAERTVEGYGDISYEPGNALAYARIDADDTTHLFDPDVFEFEAKAIAKSYILNAERNIWWDGH